MAILTEVDFMRGITPGMILLLTTGLVAETPSGWVELKSKDGAVSFAMPIQPTEKTTTQRISGGPIEVLEYSCTSGGCLYRLEKSPMPIKIPEDRLAGALKAARDSIARKYEIQDEREATVAGWPALEFQIEAPLKAGAAPSKIRMLVFYAGDEFYQVRVFALGPGREPRRFREFFDSVKPAEAMQSPSPR
ncbi:hypothetical protein P12x_004925 [Tundrisphaera lichenicola]|uniref:hypothetical protein n=1 Tax=Tundrisphaera lichenicola TaxID=2029860 RepID=UPI003EB81036